MLVLWVAFFLSLVPSSSRTLHSDDSLFWQEFYTRDGPSLTWPPSPQKPGLNPQTIIFFNFHPLIFTPAFPTAPFRAPRSQPDLLGFWYKNKRSLAPGSACFHNCSAKRQERPVNAAPSTTGRLRQKGSLRGVSVRRSIPLQSPQALRFNPDGLTEPIDCCCSKMGLCSGCTPSLTCFHLSGAFLFSHHPGRGVLSVHAPFREHPASYSST